MVRSTDCGDFRLKLKDLSILLPLTVAAFVIHGYHPAVEDGTIYIPGILKILNPSLFPYGAEFFQTHARLTLYPNLMAESVRISHAPLDYVLLFWHLLSIFLLLLACWKLSGQLFERRSARWGGVALVAALLTMPVAGTSLYVMDEYLNPRSIAIFCAVFAVDAALERRYLAVALWTILSAPIHPWMSVFGLSLVALIFLFQQFGGIEGMPGILRRAPVLPLFFPFGLSFGYPSQTYRRLIEDQTYLFLSRWQWYSWLGILGPLLLFWWFHRIARKNGMAKLDLLCKSLIIYQAVYFAMALAFTIPPRLVGLVRYQPLRSLQLVYLFMYVIGGGLLGKWVLQNKAWRWMVLFFPLSAGMFLGQRAIYASTPHIEWPWTAPGNDWLRAFAWIRENTPTDAVFALDPNHMRLPVEDHHGFRALAERSKLADANKDRSVTIMFPDLPLVEECAAQIRAVSGWKNFRLADFERLKQSYGVTWVVVAQPGANGLSCPYQNATLEVCRIN
jgi:hypothetical protein